MKIQQQNRDIKNVFYSKIRGANQAPLFNAIAISTMQKHIIVICSKTLLKLFKAIKHI